MQLSLAQKYCGLEAWRAKLQTIATAAGLEEDLLDLNTALPLRGGQTVIFQIGQEAIVKIYTKDLQARPQQPSKLNTSAESKSCRCFSGRKSASRY